MKSGQGNTRGLIIVAGGGGVINAHFLLIRLLQRRFLPLPLPLKARSQSEAPSFGIPFERAPQTAASRGKRQQWVGKEKRKELCFWLLLLLLFGFSNLRLRHANIAWMLISELQLRLAGYILILYTIYLLLQLYFLWTYLFIYIFIFLVNLFIQDTSQMLLYFLLCKYTIQNVP